MTNAIKLEVGQWVELNNGSRHEVSKAIGSAYFIGKYVYREDGKATLATPCHPLSVARILPHMTLPNGDVLFEGDYAKRRDGKVVGPLRYDGGGKFPWNAPWQGIGAYYHGADGKSCLNRSEDDLIAKADPPQVCKTCSGTGIVDRYSTWEGSCSDCTLQIKTETPKPKANKLPLWRDMTEAEKVALLLAEHEGHEVQKFDATNAGMAWSRKSRKEKYDPYLAYRKKPAEPKRKTVVLYGEDIGYGWEFEERKTGRGLTRITFPLIDGKMPTGTFTNEDGETIVVEELE